MIVLKLWWEQLFPVAVLAVACLIALPFLGAVVALGLACLGLLLMLLSQLHNLIQLGRWVREPLPQSVPESRGAWDRAFTGLLHLTRRQLHVEARLSAALEQFQLAGAAMPEGVIVLDDKDRIEWCNPRAESYFGLSSTRDRAQHITYLIRARGFVEYLKEGQFGQPLVLRVTRGAAELSLSVQLVTYGGRQKLLLTRDVTRWEQLETARRDFVANVSHELRTPLTVVSGFLETLTDMPAEEQEMRARALTFMSEQTARMLRLIEDLLTLSRLESSSDQVRSEWVDIAGMARALHADALALSAGRHRVSARVETHLGLKGNAEELRSAFSNLVTNAVRYTPEGGEVELRWFQRQNQVGFSVRDTGIGIEPHHIPRLTERFYRVDRSRSRSTGGTGLGLAIVKHVLSRHDGRLEVQSELSRGSTFTAVFATERITHAFPGSDATPDESDPHPQPG